MKILVLGHGKYYRRIGNENCICASKDFYEKVMRDENNVIVTLDIDPKVEPDVVFDFNVYKYPFKDNEFNLIIDASNQYLGKSYHETEFWKEINRILKLRGFFLGRKKSLIREFKDLKGLNLGLNLGLNSDEIGEETVLINKYGFYEKAHESNKDNDYLSLEKVHRPKYE